LGFDVAMPPAPILFARAAVAEPELAI